MFRARQRNYGCRITEFEIEGMRALTLENSLLRVGVLVDKGADIYEFLYKPRDVDPLWRSPNGIVNPVRGTPSNALAEGAFMESYEGGWQELFPTLGAASSHFGVDFGMHGEVALLPWQYSIERDEPAIIQVVLQVRTRRTPFTLRRTMTLRRDSAALLIEEEAVNDGGEALTFMWGHHPTVGAPFLQPGCLLAVPGGTVHTMRLDGIRFLPTGTQTSWPSYRAEDGHEEDLRILPEPGPAHVDELYISDLPEGWYAVTNPHAGAGFALRWDLHVFPNLWLWRTLGPWSGYPWYGDMYMLGLEPISSVPPQAGDARAAGTLLHLAAGERMAARLMATAFEGITAVTSVADDGTVTVRHSG